MGLISESVINTNALSTIHLLSHISREPQDPKVHGELLVPRVPLDRMVMMVVQDQMVMMELPETKALLDQLEPKYVVNSNSLWIFFTLGCFLIFTLKDCISDLKPAWKNDWEICVTQFVSCTN